MRDGEGVLIDSNLIVDVEGMASASENHILLPLQQDTHWLTYKENSDS